MSWVPASWVEMKSGRSQTIRKQKAKFANSKPPTESEARRLIAEFIQRHGVTRGPDASERQSMWGLAQ